MNRKFKDAKSGELRDEVTYVDVDCYGKTAENCSQYLAKGRGAFVEGRLRLDTWDDKTTGKKVYKLKVVADAVAFLGGGSKVNENDAQPDVHDQQ